jgi:hypothetical protein
VISMRPSPAANKRAIVATVAGLLGLIVFLPAGFLVFEQFAGSGTKGLVQSDQVRVSDVHWFTPSYPGVIGLSATIANASSFRLSAVDMELTVQDEGYKSEVLSDTIRLDLAPGSAQKITHYFGRPLLGRDIYNFMSLRPKFSDRAELSWRITSTTGKAI